MADSILPNWDELCATYEMARLDGLENDISDEEGELLCGAQSLAMHNVFERPAPDVAALAYKLKLFLDEEAYALCAAADIVSILVADAQRLARASEGEEAPRC